MTDGNAVPTPFPAFQRSYVLPFTTPYSTKLNLYLQMNDKHGQCQHCQRLDLMSCKLPVLLALSALPPPSSSPCLLQYLVREGMLLLHTPTDGQ